ncbi:hypothetical protein GF322_03495 [Candidatus Dependentiae bacterium]|nr:hypothetical protein [Candidatus Dependentiae bacterium]
MKKFIILLIPFICVLTMQAQTAQLKKRSTEDFSDKNVLSDQKEKLVEKIEKESVVEILNSDIPTDEKVEDFTKKKDNNNLINENKEEREFPKLSNKKIDCDGKIYLNFENAELSNFINRIAELKQINLMPDKALQGVKVSLTIREPLTVEGAWRVFLTVLDMAGFSIIERGDVSVVIPKKQKTVQPLPSYINVPLDTLPESDANIRYVPFLQNISVTTIQDLLKSMLSPEHSLVLYPEINGMIITDKSFNIRSAMKVIRELDQTGLQESVVVIKLKRANATDVKGLLDSLIQRPEQPNPIARLLGKQAESSLEYFSPTTRIIDEKRTNSLILLGNQKSIKKIEDFITNNIDKELKGAQSPLHIYELQHIDAAQAKEILESVTASKEEVASKYGAVRGGVKYFKPMKFQVDKDGNRLIVSTTDKQDWKLLKKTIEDLDKPQPQVGIETLIVTVNMDDEKELGGAIRNKYEGQIGKGVNFQSPTFAGTVEKGYQQGVAENSLLGNMFYGLTGGLGSSILTFGKGENIWGIFKALKSQSNASILSQPFFTVTNKTQANIVVGSTQHVVQQETAGGALKGYTYVSANTDLKITPQINLDGIIRLTINVVFSEFTNASLGNKDEKTLTTDVSVADGQVLVLGGFIRTKVTESQNKTPLLGDIPGLGWMFKNKKREVQKNYVFVFMSPTIIKPRQQPGINLYTRMKLHDATDYIEDAVQTKKTKDPIHNWFFNPEKEDYSHKVTDFANARYQPTTVDIKHDPYYRVHLKDEKEEEEDILDADLQAERRIQEIKSKTDDQKKDRDLEYKRKKLKELIAGDQMTIHQDTQDKKISVDDEKREELKSLIITKPEANQIENSNNTHKQSINEEKQQFNRHSRLANNENVKSNYRRTDNIRIKENINLNQLSNKMKRRQTSGLKRRSLA